MIECPALVPTGLVVVAAPPASVANATKLLTEPVVLCAVMGAQAVAELSIAISYDINHQNNSFFHFSSN